MAYRPQTWPRITVSIADYQEAAYPQETCCLIFILDSTRLDMASTFFSCQRSPQTRQPHDQPKLGEIPCLITKLPVVLGGKGLSIRALGSCVQNLKVAAVARRNKEGIRGFTVDVNFELGNLGSQTSCCRTDGSRRQIQPGLQIIG